MAYVATYSEQTLQRDDIDARAGLLVLEFGANWCGHCQGAQPAIAAALRPYPDLAHVKVEDGPGRRLGRSYRVKLWPTLIFLRDGLEVERLVRPGNEEDIVAALKRLTTE